ncbi:MAG: peptide deformylase [Syntrophorhabdaceae bacterium]|nr:peptide deformylase [Syntrophorhabdaceae bacterium]
MSKIDDRIKELIKDMFDTMYESAGIGLAATQIGVDKRVIVLDTSPSEEGGTPMALVNPEIVGSDGPTVTVAEGCLSVPGVCGEVSRPETVIVNGLNEKGEPVTLCASGILARALQHEIDHLDGVLFIDRIPPVRATEE